MMNILLFCDTDENGNITESLKGFRVIPNQQYQHFFYLQEDLNVLDYKVINNQLAKIPMPPQFVDIELTNNTVELLWDNVENEKEYQVYKNDQLLVVSDDNIHIDSEITEGSIYTYKIKTVSNENLISEFSESFVIEIPITEVDQQQS
ncbi:hypothetical protein [Metabacillus bambusae]|uniref:Fibronectin type-III domain-containing protein n=1 Tax=Metabacillus bambusae TaxID=2795218 RepID=A0ABS3NC69_9BACI|nr:hypothetical protein [Metabacillus bambusae]MBO1515651.1 hypothetical protein [Metabacillus bambusae]